MAQASRLVSVTSPLGDNVLLFRRMTATEGLSRLFEFDLDLLSDHHAIKFAEVLGQTMTVQLALPGSDEPRYFNGYVSRFRYTGTHGRYAAYQATLRPWFWLLTRTADCRIFQGKTVPAIIKEVFRDSGFTDFEECLSGSYLPWNYCVQYRETDCQFLSRLMEQEGIYFYFKHTKDNHCLVLSDSDCAHEAVPGYEEIPYFPPDQHARRDRDHIFDWTIDQQVQPGAYTLNDFDFKAPRKSLKVSSAMPREHAQAHFEIYDYPGVFEQYDQGTHYTRVRIEELQAQHEVVHGKGDLRGLAVGALFKLTGFPREDQNREYLTLAATHQLQSSEYESGHGAEPAVLCECAFSAMDARQPFRPPRLTHKPIVKGPQTAIVVGKSGEEIWTDPYGRVRCQFHWDRYGRADENSSCWIRVSQQWAGKNWGSIFIPRIGQEVIVDFLEGDPDQPIITGRVYNAEQMPPYALSEHQTQSGIKTHSTKGGSTNFNEIRFEDANGQEQVYVHAERNLDTVVEANETREVGGNRTTHVTGNFSERVNGCETRAVDGSVTETVQAGETRTIHAGVTETITGGVTQTITGGLTQTISGSESRTIEGDQTETIAGQVTHTITGALTETVSGGVTLSTPDFTVLAPTAWDSGGWQGSSYGYSISITGATTDVTGLSIAGTLMSIENTGVSLGLTGLSLETTGLNIESKQTDVTTKTIKIGKRTLSLDVSSLHIFS